MTPQTCARVHVLGADLAGLATAARLALVGHAPVVVDVTGADADAPWRSLRALEFPAPWRDLFTKSGRPLERELARAGLALVADAAPDDGADDESVRRHLFALADAWQDVRRLGVEFALPDDGPDRALARRVDWPGTRSLRPGPPRRWPRSLADVVRRLPSPLAERVLDVARDHQGDAAAMPGWLATRVSVEHTFGRWRLVASDDPTTARPLGDLVDVLHRRLDERDVAVVTERPDEPADATVVTDTALLADPALAERLGVVLPATVATTWGPGPLWRGPATWSQLGAPRVAGVPRAWRAGPLCRPGPEPWAQLLSAALVAYDLHDAVTGEDIRPTNRTPPRRRPHRDPRRRRRTRGAATTYTAPSGPPTA